MKFTEIDMETWPRREHFEYYSKQILTNYTMCVDLDVTKLRKRCKKLQIKFYPTMIYIVMKAINHHPEFRMAEKDGKLGYYDYCVPSYTIFHHDDETFSDIWTEWDEDFDQFYEYAIADKETYRDVKGVKPKDGRPDGYACISCLPWVSFTSVSHDTTGPGPMYFPIIDFGKYYQDGEKYKLPFSLMINHAAADGYHTAMLLNEIQDLCKSCKEWLV